MYSFQSRVRYSETGSDGRLTVTALLNYYQDCATFHSEAAGLSVDTLLKDRLAWVLMSWQIDMRRMPVMGETVEICTSPYRIGGALGMRSFLLRTAQGETLSVADSVWALVNVDTGKPTHVRPDFAQSYGGGERIELGWKAGPIRPDTSAQPLPEPMTVHSGMLDTNHHVNNAWYAHVASEQLPDRFTYTKLCVEYKNSAVLGDRLYFTRSERADGWIIAVNDAEGKPYALAQFIR